LAVDDIVTQDAVITRSALKTPSAAAIAGIVFSLLYITSVVLIRISVPVRPQDAGEWLTTDWKVVSFGLNLLPFAGIAFLWFMGVVRDRLGHSEDRFFATVFMGSGLLFLASLFTSAAIAGGIISMLGNAPEALLQSGLYTFGRTLTYQIITVYTMRMAGVFMISTSTLSLRTGIVPRWMAIVGFGVALVLLLTVSAFYWAPLLFPLWVLMISVHILWDNIKRPAPEPLTATVH
jgi:hypothetical protein